MANRVIAVFALVGLLAAPATAAAAEGETWHELRSEHFLVYTDLPEAEALELVRNLERFRTTLGLLVGLDAPQASYSPPLRVFAYSDYDDFVDRYDAAGTLGFYKSRADGPVAVLSMEDGEEEWEAKGIEILFHEYSHHFVHQFSPVEYPTWYDEGFAEFVSTMEFAEGKAILGKPPLERFFALRRSGDWLDLEDVLEAKGNYIIWAGPRVMRNSDRNRVGILHQYAQGWLITHFIHTHEKYRSRLGAYFSALNDPDIDPEEAFEDAFGVSYWDFDKELRAYWYEYELPYFTIDLEGAIGEFDVRTRRLSPAEAAAIDYKGRLLASELDGDEEEAKAAFAAVLDAGHREQEMRTLLARLAMEDGQWNEAERHIAAMLADDPAHAPALALKAKLMHEQLDVEEPSREALGPIRATCIEAIKADPTYVPALVTFAELYLEDSLTVSPTVLKIVESIRFLVPDYRYGQELEVRLLAKAGDRDTALRKARRLVDWAPNRQYRREYQDLLEEVEAMQADTGAAN